MCIENGMCTCVCTVLQSVLSFSAADSFSTLNLKHVFVLHTYVLLEEPHSSRGDSQHAEGLHLAPSSLSTLSFHG